MFKISMFLAIFLNNSGFAFGQANSMVEIVDCTLHGVILQVFRDAHFSGSATPYLHRPCYHNLTGDTCPEADQIGENVYEFAFHDMSTCSAIQFTGTIFNVGIRVPISNTNGNYIVIPSSCDVSDVFQQNIIATYESNGPEPSNGNYSATIGLPSVWARLTYADGSPIVSRVSVGIDVAIEISIRDDQNGFWSALAVTHIVAFGSNKDISITLIRDQCIENMLDKRLYDPTVARNSVSFPFAAFRFLNDSFVTFDIMLRVCSYRRESACVKSCAPIRKRSVDSCGYSSTRPEELDSTETSTLQLKLDVNPNPTQSGQFQAQTIHSQDPCVFKLTSKPVLIFVGVIIVISIAAASCIIYKRC